MSLGKIGSVTHITAANGEEPATLKFDVMIPKDCHNGNAELEFKDKWESGRFQKLVEASTARPADPGAVGGKADGAGQNLRPGPEGRAC